MKDEKEKSWRLVGRYYMRRGFACCVGGGVEL